MKKYRILSFLTAMLVLIGVCGGAAIAVGSDMYRASPTLAAYSAGLSAGSNPGNIEIYYNIMANSKAEEVGISSIDLYEFDGRYAATITGTTSNGLIKTETQRHRSSYTYKSADSGTSYYAVVTVFAVIDGESDSREIITNSVKAP